jgi:glycosyltransferase involved in cell wall biosynthesis
MSSTGMGKVTVLVTNDLVTDQRVHKVCTFLTEQGYEVLLLGRKLNTSLSLQGRAYHTKRFRLLFNKRIFFYAEYNLRMFFYLLFRRSDIILANDLDSLPAAWLVALLKRVRLVYDSHEYFTEVPELISRPFVQKIWLRLESLMLPTLKRAYTVSPAIAKAYKEKYGIEMQVVRNYPFRSGEKVIYNETKETRVVLYQGVLNRDRGLEEAICAMHYLENVVLHIAGGGDVESELKQLVQDEGLGEKVVFLGKIPFEELEAVTLGADLGISLEKPNGLNYTYALPNKLFNYIQLCLPVLVTALPEVEKVLEQYKVGELVREHKSEAIAEKVKYMLENKERYVAYQNQAELAKKEYCWEEEQQRLVPIFSD